MKKSELGKGWGLIVIVVFGGGLMRKGDGRRLEKDVCVVCACGSVGR